MNIVLYLASKYLKFKASDRGLSAIAVIAFLTIVISSAASVVILSAANGIHDNFLQKLMSKDAHMIILGPGKGIPAYEDYIRELYKVKGVRLVEPYFEKQALLKGNLNVMGSQIMGFSPDIYQKDADLRKQFVIQSGKFDLSKPMSIVLGYNLADNLGVSIGSLVYVTVYSEEFLSLQYKFKVTGIFSAGHKDYDSGLAFISFNDAQLVFDAPGYAYGLMLRVDKPYEIEKYVKDVRKACPYFLYTWKNLHRNDLAALEDESFILKVILFFFFIVVAFNILSTMIAMVLDKKEEIGILKAMGLKPNETLQVFLYDGFLLGIAGSTAGILAGLLIAVSINDILHFIEICIDFVNYGAFYAVFWFHRMPMPEHFHFFNSSVYYIDKFPIVIKLDDLFFVFELSVIISTLAVIFPAYTASKLRPVEVLRND